MEHIKIFKDIVNHIYWSLLLQGAAFVLLAVLIFVYPVLLFGLVSATFLVIGICLIALALKVRTFWNKVPKLFK